MNEKGDNLALCQPRACKKCPYPLTSPIFMAEVGESPDVAKPNRKANLGQDILNFGPPGRAGIGFISEQILIEFAFGVCCRFEVRFGFLHWWRDVIHTHKLCTRLNPRALAQSHTFTLVCPQLCHTLKKTLLLQLAQARVYHGTRETESELLKVYTLLAH